MICLRVRLEKHEMNSYSRQLACLVQCVRGVVGMRQLGVAAAAAAAVTVWSAGAGGAEAQYESVAQLGKSQDHPPALTQSRQQNHVRPRRRRRHPLHTCWLGDAAAHEETQAEFAWLHFWIALCFVRIRYSLQR